MSEKKTPAAPPATRVSQRIRKVASRLRLPKPTEPSKSTKTLKLTKTSKMTPVHSHVAGTLDLRECGFCSLRLPSIDDCAGHMVTEHLKDMKLCYKCSRAFVDEDEFNEHVSKHKRRNYNIFSCAHCYVHFTNSASPYLLEQHEAEKHEAERPGVVLARYLPYLSARLNMSFPRFVDVWRVATTKFHCRVCRYTNADLSSYVEHLNTCPKTEKFVCEKCLTVVTRQKTLVKHTNGRCREPLYVPSLLAHSQKAYKCKTCKKRYANKDELLAHIQTCANFSCTKCELTFTSVDAFNAHHTATHSDPLKVITCHYCRAEFISVALLDRHVKQHEKYNCLQCKKKFRTPKPLLVHLKAAHPEIEPYKCVPCDVSFKEGLHFKTHIVQHKEKGFINFDDEFYVAFTLAPPKPADDLEKSTDEPATSSKDDQMSASENDGSTLPKQDKESNEVDKSKNDEPSTSEINEDDDDKPLAKLPKNASVKNESESSDEDFAPQRNRLVARRLANRPGKLLTIRKLMKARNSYQCKICNRRTNNAVTYNKHVNDHFRSGAKQCIQCARIFRSKALHDAHVAETHSRSKPSNKLHEFLKARAQRKLEAMKLAKPKKPPHRPVVAERPPFRIKMKRVAAPTYHIIQHGQLRTEGTDVKITKQEGRTTELKIEDWTVQKYVESFQPENTIVEPEEKVQESKGIKRLTKNKALKIRGVRSVVASKMFKIRAKKFHENKKLLLGTPIPLAKPVPYKDVPLHPDDLRVTISQANGPKERTLNYGEVSVEEHDEEEGAADDVYDADYFEADDHNVAQIEILSTPIQKESTVKGKKFVIEVGETEPTTEEIENKLAEVCQKLELPIARSDLHIGQLTSQEPFYKIVNVKKALKRPKKYNTEEQIRKRLDEIKIGNAPLVSVNPLAHLLKKHNIQLEKPTPGRSIRVLSAEE